MCWVGLLGTGLEVRKVPRVVLVAIKASLLGLVLLGHVLLDKLRDEVAIGAVAIRHRAEPVRLERRRFDLLFSRHCLAIVNLRHED